MAVARSGLPRNEAEYLLLHALGRDRTDRAWLRAHDTDLLSAAAQARWADCVQRRLAGEPVAYILGTKSFYGLELTVDARVLDPRPDTETLVDWALALLLPPSASADSSNQDATATWLAPVVVDLGTGSGAIALALASALGQARPRATVWAVDASEPALEVAQANARRLGLPVRFLQGHWLAPLLAQGVRADLIVSNPPYIADDDPHMAALAHEPRQALTSGADGLDDIRHLIAHAPNALQPGGWLLLEHGHDQAPAVAALMQQQGYAQVQHRCDLAGIARCTGGQWPGG